MLNIEAGPLDFASENLDAYLPHYTEDYTSNFCSPGFSPNDSFLGPADHNALPPDFGCLPNDMRWVDG